VTSFYRDPSADVGGPSAQVGAGSETGGPASGIPSDGPPANTGSMAGSQRSPSLSRVTDHYEVSVTAPSEEEANRLGKLAVEARLAACAQVSGPITSTYWWEGKLTTANEWVCVMKTTAPLVSALSNVLRASHSYEVPEIINTRIGGHRSYLEWIDTETMGGSR
jgi:periplasmic divalent cation tolerance protein